MLQRNGIDFLKRSRGQVDASYRALTEQQRRTPRSDPEYAVLEAQANVYLQDLQSIDNLLERAEKGEPVEIENDRLRRYAGVPGHQYDPVDYALLRRAVEDNTREIARLWKRIGDRMEGSTQYDPRNIWTTLIILACSLAFAALIFQLSGG